MSILLITDEYPPDVGGIATYLHALYGDLRRDEVTIVRSFRAALSALRRTRPNVIHAGTLMTSGVLAWFLSRVFRVPYALHVYGTDLTTTRRSWLMQRLALAALRRAHRVIVISDFGSEQAAKLGVERARIVKIAPPVDARRFAPPAEERAPARTLLTVARLVPRKGHDTMLRALALVLPKMPDVRYVIAGDGPERARLESLARDLGVANAVQFAGTVDDVVPRYQACNVFVMVSRTIAESGDVEGFGIAFAEASACAKPVIAGSSGGVGDAVIDGVTGVLVPPDDPAALADAILDLLGDPETCRRLGRQGRERVMRELDPAAAVARIRALDSPSILYPTELAMLQGGSQVSLLTLLETRDRSFYRRVVVCPPGDDEYVARLDALGVRTHVAGTHPRIWRLRDIVAAARATAALVRRENVKLIHVQALVAALAAVYAKKRHPALRVVLHERGLKYRAHSRLLFRRVCRGIDRVIATTEFGRRQLIAYGVAAEKIVVIPNGTDFHRLPALRTREEVRRTLGVAPDARVIGLVANMVRVKRQELFLEVVARLPNVIGVIVGGVMPILDGEAYEREVRARADALGIADRIVFTGPRDDVPELMRAMDVLLCTSSHESFGRVLIEAMAVGTPVVATRAGAIPDVVTDGETGLLASDDPADIAEAVRRLLDDPRLGSRLAAAALEDVRLRFDTIAVTRCIEDLYRELLTP